MRNGLLIAGIGLILMGAVLLFPPVDDSTAILAFTVAVLGELFTALGVGLMIRAQLRFVPVEEEE